MTEKIPTQVITKTVHVVQYQNKFGRWLTYNTYDDLKFAETKGVNQAKAFERANRTADWSGYLEPGRDHIPRTPHGD
jgi:hypothetical protein